MASLPGANTLVDVLRERSAGQSQRQAYLYLEGGEREAAKLSYGELDRRARAIAARLQRGGLGGERAVLLYGPGLDFVAAFWGCLYAGVVAVPAYPPKARDRTGRIQSLLADCQPGVVLTTAALGAGLAGIEPLLPPVAGGWIATDEVSDDDADGWRRPPLSPSDAAFLQYTSGSTSEPRGVVVSHANLMHNEEMIRRAFRQSADSVVVNWLPLYHDMGLIGGVLQPLYCGARCILMSPMAFLQQPARWLQAVSRYQATTSGGPDFAYDLCVRKVTPAQLDGLDLSSWTMAFNGAEPVRAETLERFTAAFGPHGFRREAFYPCYGLAEATLFVAGGRCGEPPRLAPAERLGESAGPGGRGAARHLVSCGRSWLGQRLAVADPESGLERPEGEVGEIWVAGPSVALGYWHRPQETERYFGARLATGEGPYLRTGDLGFVRDGDLFVTGRLKDLIIWRGRNVYPHDLECSAAGSHPALRHGCGAAFAVAGDAQELVVVVQEIEPRREAAAGVAAEAVRGAVAEEHEVEVHEVLVVAAGSVPKTSSGKVRRQACRALWMAGALPVVARSVLAAEPDDGGASPDPAVLAALSPADAADSGATGAPQLPAASLPVLEAYLRAELSRATRRDLAALSGGERLSRMGLDSLAAITLAHRLEAAGWFIAPEELLAGPTLSELAGRLAALPRRSAAEAAAAAVPAPEAGHGGALLSYGERALWFLDRQGGGNEGAYTVGGAVRIRGPLDAAALGRSFQALADRHAALRSTFPATAGEPRREVCERLEIVLDVQDASGLNADALAERLRRELERPFDLAAGPLVRIQLFATAVGEHVLLLAAHHICCDFWSLAVLARELGELYSRELGGAAAPLPPAADDGDYAERERRWIVSAEGEAHWDYWRRQLGGELSDLELPVDRPRPPLQGFRGAAWPARCSSVPAEAARAAGRASDATLSMVLLAGFIAVLGRITGQQEVVVGSPTACRRSADSAGVVSYRVNPVVLRGNLSGDPSFAQHLERLRRIFLAAHAHQQYPFPLLAERLRPVRHASRSPLFQALFVFHQDLASAPPGLAALAAGAGGVVLRLGPLACESLAVRPRGCQFDLTLAAAETAGGLVLSLTYDRDVFDATTIQRFAGQLQVLLAGGIAQPELQLSALPLLSGPELHQLTREWNDTRRDRPQGRQTLHSLVAAQAARSPDAVAVVFAGQWLTYRQLARQATRLARRLRSLGLGPDRLVGICIERSLEMVWGLLGILGSGAGYLPLDPEYPAERLAFMLADSAVAVLLTQRSLAASLPVREGQLVLCLDDSELLADVSDLPLQVDVDPRCLAYVIYTSGSTGRPKGVAVTHSNVTRLFAVTGGAFAFGPEDVWTLFHSIAFDFSVWELWGTLAFGGRLVVVPYRVSRSPEAFCALLRRERVTVLNQTPSAFQQLIWAEGASLERGEAGVEDLRLVIFGGEALDLPSLGPWFERHGEEHPALVNMYGITETTVHVTWRRLRRPDLSRARSAMGRAIPDLSLHLLDRQGRPVPIGVPGEIHVGGAGVARGYLGRPELTAERFVPDPFAGGGGGKPGARGESNGGLGARLYRAGDLARWRPDGDVEYLGRIDHQVKVRGFRIELGEIESALAAHQAVREAAVAVWESAPGDRRLVAYMVAAGDGEPEPAELRRFLATRLPEHMLPAVFVALPSLPLTPSGKLDRRALPEPDPRASRKADPPACRTPLEAIVARALAEVLRLERVGADEDFFALGGHSLLAVSALTAIGEALGKDLPATALFSHPTAARLAAWIEAQSAPGVPDNGGAPGALKLAAPPLRRRAHGAEPQLSFAQRRLWFMHQLELDGALYNCPVALRLLGELRLPVLAQALAEIVRRHDVLRGIFPERLGEPVQQVLPARMDAVPRFAVVDLGALAAAARDGEEQRLRSEEACRPFDLARGPLWRAAVLKLGEWEYVALVTLHHIVTDDWSLGVLVRELTALYTAFRDRRPSPLPELPIQYADFAVWQREWLEGEALASDLRYWREQLAGAPSQLALPTDREPEHPSSRGALHSFELPAETCERLDTLGREANTSLFVTLLAAFQTLLYRSRGQDDIVVGVDVANRTRPETEPLIGFFVNLLPLRGDFRGNPTFTELLGRVRRAALGAFAHQDLPYEKLVEELRPERLPGQTPFARAIFSFRPVAREPLRLPGIEAMPLPPREDSAKRDLTLFMERCETGLAGAWSYRTDLFDAATIARMASCFVTLLDSIVRHPDSRLDALAIEPRAAREQHAAETRRRRDLKLVKLLEINSAARPEERNSC